MGWRPQKSKRRFLSKECKDPVESGGMLNGKVVSCKLLDDGGSLLTIVEGLAV